MKIRKKQNDSNMSEIFAELEDKSKESFLHSEDIDDLNQHIMTPKDELQKVEPFSSIDQLDIMDISVSNFTFSSFNKIELDGLDIINEDPVPLDNFEGVIENSKTVNISDKPDLVNIEMLKELKTEFGKDVSTDSEKDETFTINRRKRKVKVDKTAQLKKRALQRKQRIEQSKVQCPVRSTTKHYIKMLHFFETNPGLATGQLQKEEYRKKWKELTNILNSMRLGEKTTEKWQKTWSDYKLHLKKKVAGIKRSGKALDVPNTFSDIDCRALNIMGILDEEVDHDSIKKRFNPSVENEDSSSHCLVDSSNQEINCSIVSQNRTNKQVMRRKRAKSFKRRLLLQQRQTLIELRNIKTTLRDGFEMLGMLLGSKA